MIKNIFKHILIMAIITTLIVLSMPYLKRVIQDLVQFYPLILTYLGHVFAGGKIGMVIKEVIAIVLIPVAVAAIAHSGWYVIKRTWMPHLINFGWIMWIIVISTIVLLRG